MKRSLTIIAGLLLGVAFSRFLWPSPPSIANETPGAPPSTPYSVIESPQLAEEALDFRTRLFEQRGRPTLEASRALYRAIQADPSPGRIAACLRELQASAGNFDPVPKLLAQILQLHLQAHAPSTLPAFSGEAATEHALDRREDAYRSWAALDPDAAFSMAMREPVITLRPTLLEAVLLGATGTDPEAAYRLWSSIKEPDLRHRLSEKIAWAVSRHAPERVAHWIQEFPTKADDIQEYAFEAWAGKDPAKALSALRDSAEFSKPTSRAVKGLLAGWSEKAPAEAAAWAEERGLTLAPESLRQWAQIKPEAALAHAGKAKTLSQRLEGLAKAAESWLSTEPAEALAWTEKNLDDAARFQVSREFLKRHQGAPDQWSMETAAWLAQYPHPHATEEAGRFTQRWNDLPAALAWLDTLPETANRRLMPYVYGDWLREDPNKAGDYLLSLPTPRAQARLIADSLGQSDPQTKDQVQTWAKAHLSEAAQAFLAQTKS